LAEVRVVLAWEIRWEPEDRVPVTLGDTVVGVVKRVRNGYSRIGEPLVEITVDIADNVWRSVNYEQALNGGPPPLHIHFPRSVNDLNTSFVMGE
jgi:hypothetical protein